MGEGVGFLDFFELGERVCFVERNAEPRAEMLNRNVVEFAHFGRCIFACVGERRDAGAFVFGD